jgi:hypothetical protein
MLRGYLNISSHAASCRRGSEVGRTIASGSICNAQESERRAPRRRGVNSYLRARDETRLTAGGIKELVCGFPTFSADIKSML